MPRLTVCSVLRSDRCDQRGFALQTIIVMTALISVALAVSAVILTRGGETADDLQRQRLTFDPSRFQNQAVCEAYDFQWVGGVCQEPP